MPHSLSLSGWPFYFLNLSTIKKAVANIDQAKNDEIDSGAQKNEFFPEDLTFAFDYQEDNYSGLSKMEAGLQSINKLLLSVIGQPRGNLVTSQTPITQVRTIFYILM